MIMDTRTYYTSENINFLISTYIREYDISKANINILYRKGILNESDYNYLCNCPNKERKVKIGLFLRDNKQYVKVLEEGIREVRKEFVLANNIQEEDILSVKNDAIFIINKIPSITKFDNVEFKCKNVYTSFYKLNNSIEVYYSYNSVTNNEIIEIKGIKDENLLLHEPYFLDFLKAVFCSAETENIKETLDILTNFYNQYISLKLEVGYYREFNSLSYFNFRVYNTNYYTCGAQERDKIYLNIINNMEIIRTLFSYFSFIQMNAR